MRFWCNLGQLGLDFIGNFIYKLFHKPYGSIMMDNIYYIYSKISIMHLVTISTHSFGILISSIKEKFLLTSLALLYGN